MAWYHFRGYRPHIIYSLAITSISVHLVSARQLYEDERAHTEAQISILRSVVDQLRAGKTMTVDELERVKRLARPSTDGIDALDISAGKMTWREAFLGSGRKSQ
ncbi:hypothetical protein C8J56DRAFT_195585 [Mycena floridula]|nr:hypothetical protein C8J56DRAFT_195585 [Mycena floridula]